MSMVRIAARRGNKANDENSRSGIPKSVRRWVLAPIIGFTIFGTGCLTYILVLFSIEPVPSQWAWPALIIALAGLPSTYVINTKRWVDAVKTTMS